MKVCPVCKSKCFDDMDTCYNCLHNFSENNTNDNKIDNYGLSEFEQSNNNLFIPEYFEIDSFPYIEDKSVFENYRYNKSGDGFCNTKLIDYKSKEDNIILSVEVSKKQLLEFVRRH